MARRVAKMTVNLPDKQHRKFNKVTEKTLKLAEQKKGLKKFNILDELFKDLGI